MTELEEVTEEIVSTIPCPLCGRKFLPERLEKHTTVCNRIKQSEKKRKKFDSQKQRSDLESSNGYPVTPPIKSPKSETKTNNKTSNWREKHEEFLRTVRQARGEKVDDIEVGEKGRVPVGYIECKHCGRNFSDKAADRHISFCREQKARIPRSANNGKAMERMKARIKYKPSSRESPKAETPPKTVPKTPLKPIMSKSSRPSPPNSLIRKTPPKHSINSNRNSSLSKKSDQKRIISLSRPKNVSPDHTEVQPKTPVMKFKEKFPNHMSRQESKYIPTNQLMDIMKKSDNYNSAPRTVPGVRTGGLSPVKCETSFSHNHQNGHYESDDEELTKLKTRIEEMYINSGTNNRSNTILTNSPIINGTNGRKFGSETTSESTTRGSTSGSSDSSVPNQSRDNSSEGTRSQSSNSGLPKFCHQCGTKYPITVAKYCYECGSRRLGTIGPFV